MKHFTILGILLIGVTSGCGGKGPAAVLAPSSNDSGGSPSGAGIAPGTGVFLQSPLELADITVIVPPGNLNPPDHTLPTNHAYFFHSLVANAEVKAPAAGTVTSIQHGSDDQVMIGVSSGFQFYISHIRLDPAIAQDAKVTAGQRLGVTAST